MSWNWGWCNQPCSWHGLRARSPGVPYGTPHSSPGRSRVGQYRQQRHRPGQCLLYAPCRCLPTATPTPPSWATRHHFSFPLGVLHVVAIWQHESGLTERGMASALWAGALQRPATQCWPSKVRPPPRGRGPCRARPPRAGWAGHGLRPVGGGRAMPSHPSAVPPLSQSIKS